MSIRFDNCVKRGGKVRTEIMSKTKYRRTCEIDGKKFFDSIKTKKK